VHAIALGKKTGFLTLFYATNFDKYRHKYTAAGHPVLSLFADLKIKREEKIVAYPYKIPYFKKMYPDASKEVLDVLKVTERKMRYQEYDLKTEKFIVDSENNKVTVIPSREDSYERLLDIGVQFEEKAPGVEEQMLGRMEAEQLHKVLSFLSADEQYLIQEIYFHERTERDLAKELGYSQNAINKRKKRILDKLRRLMENL
jgi:DNA-directed RNA polymerase specialized sigma subunit, sigma24 homolog